MLVYTSLSFTDIDRTHQGHLRLENNFFIDDELMLFEKEIRVIVAFFSSFTSLQKACAVCVVQNDGLMRCYLDGARRG